MSEKTLIDASVPNAGRIYDYMLGGHHNFEVDRQAGERIKTAMPPLPQILRLMRWSLQDVAPTLTKNRGFDTIIDFASGLPTQDHIHTAVAPGTTVIYSDHDPICVEYGREILGDTPNTHYFQADARDPAELLGRPEVLEILGGTRHVGFIYWGIAMYLTDEDIARAARVLYDWSDDTSCLAYFVNIGDPDSPMISQMAENYRRMGEALHFRPVETFQELVKPWHADDLGYRPMSEWHGIDIDTQELIDSGSPGGGGAGVYLVK